MISGFFKCKECKGILLNNNINDFKQFLKWSLLNHPDKGGKLSVFQEVSNCVDIFFRNNEECNKYNYSDKSNSNSDFYKKPYKKPSDSSDKSHSHKKPSKSPKKSKSKSKSPKNCPSGYERNPDTGRCRIKCNDDQYRDPVSQRCRKSPKSKK